MNLADKLCRTVAMVISDFQTFTRHEPVGSWQLRFHSSYSSSTTMFGCSVSLADTGK